MFSNPFLARQARTQPVLPRIAGGDHIHRLVLMAAALLFSSHAHAAADGLDVVIGASSNLGVVMDFSDAMILVMSVPYLIGVYLLAPVIRRELDSYLTRLHSGEVRSFRQPPQVQTA